MGGAAPAGLVTPAPAELLAVAQAAAHAAEPLLLERYASGRERAVGTKSSPTDLVSEADHAAERAIRAVLAERRPHDAVVGEEGDDVAGSSGLRWIVDPLDGTVNFLFGIPQWCVSVAVGDAQGTIAGVVLDPVRGELFAAARERAATLNGEPVSGSACADLSTALVATGFGYEAAVREHQAATVARLLPRVRDIRRMGSAALDLAWTACGRCDAFYERGVRVWDTAAGELLCARAGLEVRALTAAGPHPAGVLAAPAPLVGPLLEIVGA